MTERLLLLSTQNAHSIPSAAAAATTTTATNPAIAAHDAPAIPESVEEEPYTIKCICDYSDDDGNTIYCETCDTWQHIECFYPGRVDDASREEFDHSCADCKPRPFDRRHATERQRHQRQNKVSSENGDKKTKRPPSKSHKKKAKPSDVQVNGFHDHDGHKHGSPQEHQSHTKSKGHRSSKSVNSVAKRSPSYNSRPHNHAHPPSPAHTPPDLPNNFEVHGYSENFQSLYKDDPATTTDANTYSSLTVSNALSSWLHDSLKLKNDTGVENRDEVFYKVKVGLDELKWPELRVERKDTVYNGAPLHWRYLTSPKQLTQSGRIGELNGLVGFQRDYVNDPDNRWSETSHPQPFVFFHPRLPIFIDTRRQGSKCRYVRRSCRPNTSLEIYTVADSAEYHFWLISEGDLAANEQITLNWDFRFPADVHSRFVRLLKLGDEDEPRLEGEGAAELTEEEYTIISDVIHQVLSDHGGCACDLGSDCAFARFHQNYHGRLHAQSNGTKPKKGRKPKNHASPNGTGHATNSRAASEGQDHFDEDDTRSISGSIKSNKPRSRDLTPLQGVREVNGIPTETSDREKRKLAMEEQLFQKQAEQGQPPRKKKRASESTLSSASANPQPNAKLKQRSSAQRIPVPHLPGANGTGSRGRQYVDAGTSRRQSGSPYGAVSPTPVLPSLQTPTSRRDSVPLRSRQPSATVPRNYVDSSTQTEEVEGEWFSRKCETPKAKKNIISLSTRLLRRRQKLREQQEGQTQEVTPIVNGVCDAGSVGSSAVSAMDLDTHDQESIGSPTEVRGRTASIVSSSPSVDVSLSTVDVQMADAPTATLNSHSIPPPPQWPPTASDAGLKSPEMRLQLPPAPSLPNPSASGAPGSAPPSSTSPPTTQAPYTTNFTNGALIPPPGNGVLQPSPIKTTKKLSLSDYKARRKMTDTAAASKPSTGSSPTVTHAVLKPSLSTVEEIKANGVFEGSALVESPMVEKALDPMHVVGDTATASRPSPPEGLNGSL